MTYFVAGIPYEKCLQAKKCLAESKGNLDGDSHQGGELEKIISVLTYWHNQTDLASNMLDKKNEGNHKASNASHSCDETQEAKEVDSKSCLQVDADPIPRAERPGWGT